MLLQSCNNEWNVLLSSGSTTLGAIFFMTNFYTAEGGGGLDPLDTPGSATVAKLAGLACQEIISSVPLFCTL